MVYADILFSLVNNTEIKKYKLHTLSEVRKRTLNQVIEESINRYLYYSQDVIFEWVNGNKGQCFEM